MKNLYNLIQNLSQSEKRYIKLRLKSTKSSSDTLLYFDELAAQKEYNFDGLMSLDDKSVTVLRSNLDKLYRSILKQLRLFHASSSSESKLQGVLQDVNLLKDKGLIKEAKKLNAKLIKSCKEEEQFGVLKKALSNQWILFHLSGMLTFETTNELEKEIEDCRMAEEEIEQLNTLYRKGVSLYYSYFFKNKKPEYLEEIKEVLKNERIQSPNTLSSDSAKMVAYEISSLCHMVLGDLNGHHEKRKGQLELLFTSRIFEKDHLNKLLVMSNLFPFLKREKKLKEFNALLSRYKIHFYPIVSKSGDGVLTEKYYDVLFQNSIFKMQFSNDTKELIGLVDLFEEVVGDKLLTNSILLSRTFLSLAEALLMSGEAKRAIPLLVQFQNLEKGNKQSKQFVDSEMFFLYAYWSRKNFDSLENKLTSLQKYFKRNPNVLDEEQNAFFKVISETFKNPHNKSFEKFEFSKPSFKLITESLTSEESVEFLKQKMFIAPKEEYSSSEDSLLKIIK